MHFFVFQFVVVFAALLALAAAEAKPKPYVIASPASIVTPYSELHAALPAHLPAHLPVHLPAHLPATLPATLPALTAPLPATWSEGIPYARSFYSSPVIAKSVVGYPGYYPSVYHL